MKLQFGKYRNCDLRNIPQDYLRWLLTLTDLQPDVRRAVTELLEHYRAMKKGKQTTR